MDTPLSLYGLGVQVNVPIAGLSILRAPVPVDVRISLGCMPPFRAEAGGGEWVEYHIGANLDEDGQPRLRVWRSSSGGHFRIAYSDGTTVVVDARGSSIWATAPETATVEDTATYLLGPIFGFLLRLRGVTCLHASAIAVDDQAIALVGPSGCGKSTTAAAFARLGYPILTDDVLALVEEGGVFMAQPAYPRLRLWPSSVEALYGAGDALPRITPGWDKRFLDLDGKQCRFQNEALPLAAIYLLDDRRADLVESLVESVGARESVMSLVGNTCSTNLLDKKMRADEFNVLDRMVKGIPVRRVVPRAAFVGMPQLCDSITEDFRHLATCAAS